jgi:hypothetical protein
MRSGLPFESASWRSSTREPPRHPAVTAEDLPFVELAVAVVVALHLDDHACFVDVPGVDAPVVVAVFFLAHDRAGPGVVVADLFRVAVAVRVEPAHQDFDLLLVAPLTLADGALVLLEDGERQVAVDGCRR